MVRGSWRPNRTAIYWPPLLWPSALCLSRSPGLLNRRPRGPLCWMRAFSTASCHQQVSKHHRGSQGPLRPGVDFPTTSYQQLLWTPTQSGAPRAPSTRLSLPHLVSNSNSWLLVLTELYISSTPTQSPTQSLEWHVWSSSSENNCHAVHRSLSSGASVYECTMEFFYLVPFPQLNPAYAISFNYWPLGCVTSFWCITLEWHICPGRRSQSLQLVILKPNLTVNFSSLTSVHSVRQLSTKLRITLATDIFLFSLKISSAKMWISYKFCHSRDKTCVLNSKNSHISHSVGILHTRYIYVCIEL